MLPALCVLFSVYVECSRAGDRWDKKGPALATHLKARKWLRKTAPAAKISTCQLAANTAGGLKPSQLRASWGLLQGTSETGPQLVGKVNTRWAEVERYNYNISSLQAHEGAFAFSITCDATWCGGDDLLSVALTSHETSVSSFGPPRVP